MEILQADNELREEIINDAKTKADRLIKKAEKEAEDVKKNIDAQVESIKKEYQANIIDDVEEKIKLFFASVDIEVKKSITQLCGKIIDEVFDDIYKSILDNKICKYEDFIYKIICNYSSRMKMDSYFIEASKNELERISDKTLLSFKIPDSKITKVEESKDLEDGMMLYSSDKKIGSFISIKNYLDNLKMQKSAYIANLLLQGKIDG